MVCSRSLEVVQCGNGHVFPEPEIVITSLLLDASTNLFKLTRSERSALISFHNSLSRMDAEFLSKLIIQRSCYKKWKCSLCSSY